MKKYIIIFISLFLFSSCNLNFQQEKNLKEPENNLGLVEVETKNNIIYNNLLAKDEIIEILKKEGLKIEKIIEENNTIFITTDTISIVINNDIIIAHSILLDLNKLKDFNENIADGILKINNIVLYPKIIIDEKIIRNENIYYGLFEKNRFLNFLADYRYYTNNSISTLKENIKNF